MPLRDLRRRVVASLQVGLKNLKNIVPDIHGLQPGRKPNTAEFHSDPFQLWMSYEDVIKDHGREKQLGRVSNADHAECTRRGITTKLYLFIAVVEKTSGD